MKGGFAGESSTASLVGLRVMVLGSISIGAAMAFPSMTIGDIASECGLSDLWVFAFMAIMPVCAIFGGLLGSAIVRTLSRGLTCQIITWIDVLSWMFIYVACERRKANTLIHRAFVGIASGCYSVVIPYFIVSTAPPEERRFFTSLHNFGIAGGCFLVSLVGHFLSWRHLVIVTGAIPLLFCAVSIILPEDVKSVGGSVLDGGPRAEELCRSLTIAFVQQASGVGAVVANLRDILGSSAASVFAASAACIGAIVSMLIARDVGRHVVLLLFILGSSVPLLVIAFVQDALYVCTAAAFIFLFFCFVVGPAPNTAVMETFHEGAKRSASLVMAVNWTVAAFVMVMFALIDRRIALTTCAVTTSIGGIIVAAIM